jgi:hypothetical protein
MMSLTPLPQPFPSGAKARTGNNLASEKTSYRKLLQPIVSAGEKTSRRTFGGIARICLFGGSSRGTQKASPRYGAKGLDERSVAMCDYSLERIASRAAATGDRLVTADFPGTITGGFAGIGDPNTAVCLKPGTELVFDSPPKYHQEWALWPKTATETLARFRQINLDTPQTHHDALEFSDGTIVTLARLFPGQRATVLQLPASSDSKAFSSTETEQPQLSAVE